MNKFEKLGAFYLGRLRDEAKAPLLYDSKDLTTHGLVVGMTGSGKTGLSVVLLEEAALDGIPALIAGISHQPHDEWMKQVARNLTDAVDGFLRNACYLIHDRDPLFSESFRAMLGAVGAKTVKLPVKSPNLNAYAERFVRSIKYECLNRMVLLGENHLRLVVREYIAHFHFERNHQGLDNELILPSQNSSQSEGSVRCRDRLGGTLRYSYREAA